MGDLNILKEVAKNYSIDIFENKKIKIKKKTEDIVKNSDIVSRSKGISGVPFFIINETYAISGAQENEVFEKVFETCLVNS